MFSLHFKAASVRCKSVVIKMLPVFFSGMSFKMHVAQVSRTTFQEDQP